MPAPAITKKALAESMKELMNEMSFEKISVGHICEKCGMARKSFYYHFKDKYDLVNWIFYTEYISVLQSKNYSDIHELFQDTCSYFFENRSFYINAFNVEGQNSFTEFFSETLQAIAYDYTQDRIGDHEFRDFFCSFFTNAFRESIVQWLKSGAVIPPERFASLLAQAFSGIPPKSSGS